MPKKKLTAADLDILDGINIPTIAPNTKLEAPTSAPIKKEDGNIEGKDLKRISPVDDLGGLLDALKSKLDENPSFDSLTGENFRVQDGAIAGDLTNEQIEALIAHTRKSITNIQSKSKIIMDAVVKRQELEPTIVSFDHKRNRLLKRGMVRVFGHKANTITFDQYRAALEARKILSERLVKEKLGDV